MLWCVLCDACCLCIAIGGELIPGGGALIQQHGTAVQPPAPQNLVCCCQARKTQAAAALRPAPPRPAAPHPTLPPPTPPRLQAESREHRRWIERYNRKLREQGKKEEFKRIREFVESAYKQDPRWVDGVVGGWGGFMSAVHGARVCCSAAASLLSQHLLAHPNPNPTLHLRPCPPGLLTNNRYWNSAAPCPPALQHPAAQRGGAAGAGAEKGGEGGGAAAAA